MDSGPEQPLAINPSSGAWQAPLDTTSLTNGGHTVSVINHTLSGAAITDRAWNVQIANANAPASTSPSITITNPVSNGVYAGTISVLATGQNLTSAVYRLDGGAPIAMSNGGTDNRWAATLETHLALAGRHTIDVVGADATGATVSDRAWSVTFSPTAVRIGNPLTDQPYSGAITVQAFAQNARSTSYRVDDGSEIPMSFNASSGAWESRLDTTSLSDGSHTVAVVNHGLDAISSTDRAWNVVVRNASARPVNAPNAKAPNPSRVASPSTPAAQPVMDVVGNSQTTSDRLLLSLIGDDTTTATLSAERSAGVNAKVIRVSWKDFLPREGVPDATYVAGKRAEIASLRRAGFGVILDIGLQDTPVWLHTNYPDSYYVNQFGERYFDPGLPDLGDANLVFNAAVRAAAADYIDRVFDQLGTGFRAVRLGGGRYGELTYPPARYNGHTNVYWGFDANALRSSPTHNWVPGQPQVAGEASAFIGWYLDALVSYQNWQITTIRRSFPGALMVLYPSWGIRPGQLNEAISDGLNGSSSAEINGEVERGFDFARQIAAIDDPDVVVATTWLDADASGDGGADSRSWSPVHYLASLAQGHPLHLAVYGENTGQGGLSALKVAAGQVARFGLIGMAWFNEREVLSGQYATLADLGKVAASLG